MISPLSGRPHTVFHNGPDILLCTYQELAWLYMLPIPEPLPCLMSDCLAVPQRLGLTSNLCLGSIQDRYVGVFASPVGSLARSRCTVIAGMIVTGRGTVRRYPRIRSAIILDSKGLWQGSGIFQ